MKPSDRFDSLLQWYAEQHNLDWRAMKAQMLAESDANPQAVSRVGAQGLFQAMPATLTDVLPGSDPFNPESSIEFGALYMAALLNHYHGELAIALAAYNYGEGNVDRLLARYQADWRVHLPSETQHYLATISAHLGRAV